MDGLELNANKRKQNFQKDKPVHHGNRTVGSAAVNLFDIVPSAEFKPALMEEEGSVQGWSPQQAEAAISKLEAEIKANKSKIAWQENVIKDLSIQSIDKDYTLDQLQSQVKELTLALELA